MSTALARTVPATGALVGQRLGAFPPIALVGASGLLIVALADTLARLDVPGAPLLWWAGIVAIVLPAAIRLLGRSAGRGERLAIVVTVALALYLVKVLHGPGAFVMFDEFQHWATLQDINDQGRLFTPNSILVASPYYPGVEIVADLLTRSGLPVWESGVLVIGAARLLQALALFLVFERVSGSARVAGIGALVYMTNPSFLFFDAQFSYESVALPIATYAVWLAVRREPSPEAPDVRAADRTDRVRGVLAGRIGSIAGTRLGLTLVAMLAVASVVVTHHVTAIALSTFLVAWAVVSLGLRLARRPGAADVIGLTIITVIATVAWMLYVASVTVRYLAPAVSGALSQVVDLVGGGESGRELFRSATGQAAPAWEQGLGYASVAVALLLIPIGLPIVWRRYRDRSAALALGAVALVYPVTLVARLTTRGAELSARSGEFVFLGVAFVGALGVVALMERYEAWRIVPPRAVAPPAVDDGRPRLAPTLPPPAAPDRRMGLAVRTAAVAGIIVLSVGGVILGVPAWARLPGPYLVSADPRSVEPQGLAAATWAGRWLDRDSRFLSDRTNRMLLTVYGRQHPITAVGDRVDVKDAYFSLRLLPEHVARLKRAAVRYVIADRRLPSSLPYVGVYLERGEIQSRGPWLEPLPKAAIDKWDALAGSDRIYDAGDIRIFDVERLTDARS